MSMKRALFMATMLVSAISCMEEPQFTGPLSPLKASGSMPSLEVETKAESLNDVCDVFGLYAWSFPRGGSPSTPNYCYNETMTRNGSSWISENRYPQIPDQYSVYYWALAPQAPAGLTLPERDAYGKPTIRYIVPENAQNQQDIIAAEYLSEGGSTDEIKLQFRHLLSALRFRFSADGAFDGQIKAIKLQQVYTAADYKPAAGWTSQRAASTLSVNIGRSFSESDGGRPITLDNQTFMLIPGCCSNLSRLEIIVNDGTKDISLTAPMSAFEFEQGTITTLYLDLSSLASTELIIEKMTVDSWFESASYTLSYAASWMVNVNSFSGGSVTLDPLEMEEGTKMVIDWGDGTVEKINPVYVKSSMKRMFYPSHHYLNRYYGLVKIYISSGCATAEYDHLDAVSAYTVINGDFFKIKKPVDLSKCDFISEQECAQSTANCYVVRHPGRYFIPLVYGNAIAGGQINTSSYRPGVSGSNVLTAFLNAKGVAISSPYIETDVGTASAVAVGWMDTRDMICDVQFETVKDSPCRYISFKVNKMGGNALLVILDSEGTVLWSWHIWSYDGEVKRIVIDMPESIPHTVLNIPLGYQMRSQPTATYYQWGRKDPMLPGISNGPDKEPNQWGPFRWTAGLVLKKASIAEGIRKPYSSFSEYDDWCTTSYLNLWDGDSGLCDVSDPVLKTVYDPCPSGFHVARFGTFEGLSYKNAVGQWQDGWFMKLTESDAVGHFFPASGLRSCNTSSSYSSNTGCFWFSVPSGSEDAACFRYNSSYTGHKQSYFRACAHGVWPEAD